MKKVEMETIRKIFSANGFPVGRIISGSKSGYRFRNPENHAIFNANIFTPEKHLVWSGDLDVTLDNENLQKICDEINEELLVTTESIGWYAESKSYVEIEKYGSFKFTPKFNFYLKRIYDGLDCVKAENMSIITSKGIDWEEIKISK